METGTAATATLSGRTFLVGSSQLDRQLSVELEARGANVISWPESCIREFEDHHPLDEAIENLFGYDWIIFRNIYAVEYFLRRFYHLNRETNELDDLHICAIGAATIAKVATCRIHIDVSGDHFSTDTVVGAIKTYLGG